MKKLIVIAIIAMFLTVGCSGMNRTMGGAGAGAGAGGLVALIAGKSGSTAALWVLGGALAGALVGNTLDEQAKNASLQPQNRGKLVIAEEEGPTNAQTKCRKVTKKTWKDGNRVSETTEEVCTGNRTSNVYE